MESLSLQVDGPITGRDYIPGEVGGGGGALSLFLFTGRWAYNRERLYPGGSGGGGALSLFLFTG